MSLRYITSYGAIETTRGYPGIDHGDVPLENLTPEQALAMLPGIVRSFDERLCALEEKTDA